MTEDEERMALRPMGQDELSAFRDTFIEDWAADLARVEGLPLDRARAEATRRTDADLEAARADDGQRFYTITAGDHAVGTLWFAFANGRAFLNDITVAARARGRGYGRRALELMEAELRALGVTLIQLNVYEHNPRARALYEKLGFAVTGRKMTKRLEGAPCKSRS